MQHMIEQYMNIQCLARTGWDGFIHHDRVVFIDYIEARARGVKLGASSIK